MPNGIGIDFGATAWRAAICEDGRCRPAPETVCVPGERGMLTSDPRRTIPLDPDNPQAGAIPRLLWLESAKANLGTRSRLRDVKGHIADTFETQASVQIRALKAKLEEHLGAEIVGAAVGVPACYGMNQRAALRSIAEAAGWGSVALIDESIAAALSSYRQTQPRYVLVYCLGRSVFAASVLCLESGQPQALDHEGSTQLGGQDFEAMLVQGVVAYLRQHEKVDIRRDHSAIRELFDRTERVKIALSTASEAVLEVERSEDPTGPAFRIKLEVSRTELERLIAPLVAQTISLSRKAVQAANLRPEDLTEVLLVGEATHTPLVLEEVSRAFGRPSRHAAADAVACGAALYAASLYDCFVPRTGSRPAKGTTAPRQDSEAASAATVPDADREKPVAPAPPVDESEDALVAAIHRARQISRMHGLEAGIEAFEDLLNQVHVEISYLYSRRASELRQEGREGEAQAKLERGFQHWPENENIRALLAEIYVSKGWYWAQREFYPLANEQLRKSQGLDPTNASAKELAQFLQRAIGGTGRRTQRTRRGR